MGDDGQVTLTIRLDGDAARRLADDPDGDEARHIVDALRRACRAAHHDD